MRQHWIHRFVGGLVLFAAMFSGLSTTSDAAPLTVTLVRTSGLTNVDDAAGRWQFDGGEVRFMGSVVARFARVKRVVFGGGTDVQNTAMLTITIFLLGEDPPQNVTLQGSHSFNSGQIIGSISGASSLFSDTVGVTFHGTDAALTFDLP